MSGLLVKRFRAHWKTCRDVIWADPLNRGHKLQFTIQYLYWHAYAKFRKDWVITLENGMRSIVKRYPDNDSGELGIYTRNMDYHEIQFVRQFLPSGTYLIDAGCNVGNRTLALSDLLEGAFLIDAGVDACRRASEHLALNNLDTRRFKVIQKAIGASTGQVFFSDRGGASTLNRVVSTPGSTATRAVELTTIDHELSGFSGVVSVLKVDVEGFDYDALVGASQLLQSPQLRLVMFERIPDQDLNRLISLFDQKNWKIVALDRFGKPSDRLESLQQSLNLFAVRREFLSLIN